jgi:hypothetical protein
MTNSGFLTLFGRCRDSLLLSAACVALPGIAWCQVVIEPEPVEEVEEVRRYTVEMIVFEYADSAVSGGEIFEPEELPEDEVLLPMPPPSFSDPGASLDADLPVAIDDTEIIEDEALEFLLSEEPEEEQVLEELPSHILLRKAGRTRCIQTDHARGLDAGYLRKR